MKNFILKSSLLLSSVVMANSALANTDLILTPLNATGAAWLKSANAPKVVVKKEKAFSDGEQKALSDLGGHLLIQAEVWTLSADEKVEALSQWISQSGNVGVETRETLFQIKGAEAFSLEKHQWALKNVGEIVKIDIDDVSTTTVKGKLGEDIGLSRAKKETQIQKPVIVAVLDTGVDYTHPDLMDAVAIKVSECKADLEFAKCNNIQDKGEKESCKAKWGPMDSDGNGYVRDCAGWNTAEGGTDKDTGVRGNNKALDENGHGTHIAGIIAATGKEGVRGVSKNIRFLPVKVLTASPEGPVRPQSSESLKDGVPATEDLPSPDERGKKWSSALVDNVARGVLYSLRSGAQVINISLGWGQKANSPLLKQILELATSKNVIVVAAAGNDATDALISPCDFDGVICVASHDPDGKITHFSNFGPGVDIAAPGLNVLSTWPRTLRARLFTDRRGYNLMNGTSQATPYVAGVAGRMLGEGIPNKEIYPRLMLGARQPEFNYATDKVVLSGNLDLARSEAVSAQSLILPASRKVVRIAWDRKATNLTLPIRLKNFWSKGEQVSIELISLDPDFSITQNKSVSFSSWNEDEIKSWSTDVQISNRNIKSDLLLVAEVKINGQLVRRIPLAFEIYVSVTEKLADDRLIRSVLQNKIEIGSGSVRSVTGLGEFESQFEFTQIQAAVDESTFTFYQFDGKSNIKKLFGRKLKVPTGELLLIQKGRFFGAVPGYALIYRVRTESPKDPLQVHFLFFNLNMEDQPIPGKTGEKSNLMVFDNKRAVINDKFNWMKNGNEFVPMWIAPGYIPDLEKPKFDPWNPNPVEERLTRVFYGTEKGVRSVQIEDEDLFPIDIILPTSEEKLKGEFSVLLGKGEEFDTEFFVGTVSDGKLSNIRPLELKQYRQLQGLRQFKLMGVDARLSTEGSVFMGSSVRASQRITAFQNDKVVLDGVLAPLKIVDAVINLIGAFKGKDTGGAFSQTIYDLQYHDFKTGQVHAISSRRFSFLPLSLFGKTMVPMLVKQGRGDFLPAVYSGAGQGLSISQDVIIPRKNKGVVTSLVRPAFLRLESGEGCKELANVIPATSEKPALFPFVCANEVLFVPAEMDETR